jgi:hypothetical protein
MCMTLFVGINLNFTMAFELCKESQRIQWNDVGMNSLIFIVECEMCLKYIVLRTGVE